MNKKIHFDRTLRRQFILLIAAILFLSVSIFYCYHKLKHNKKFNMRTPLNEARP